MTDSDETIIKQQFEVKIPENLSGSCTLCHQSKRITAARLELLYIIQAEDNSRAVDKFTLLISGDHTIVTKK